MKSVKDLKQTELAKNVVQDIICLRLRTESSHAKLASKMQFVMVKRISHLLNHFTGAVWKLKKLFRASILTHVWEVTSIINKVNVRKATPDIHATIVSKDTSEFLLATDAKNVQHTI